jgi:choline dehydrogenase-like flavoprotein
MVNGRLRQPVQRLCYAWHGRPDAFVDDIECPYSVAVGRPFLWFRVRGLRGRVGIPSHGRLYFRFGPNDFAPIDGASPPWPFAPDELDLWYASVEDRLGISGSQDGLPWLPDSRIAHRLIPTATESEFIAKVRTRWPGVHPIIGRFAPPADTLEGAARTGRLSLRQGAVVHGITVERSRATGVSWYDQISGRNQSVSVPLIFLCASALESTRILMLSRDAAKGRPIGAGSNALGCYLMDHVKVNVEAVGDALAGGEDIMTERWRCVYLPRFDAREAAAPGPARGYGVQVYQGRSQGNKALFIAVAFAEMTPRAENRVMLDRSRLDRWGIPTLHIDCSYGEKELARVKDQIAALRVLADVAGSSIVQLDEATTPPGGASHECGTARMGHDPATSILDPYNQCWDAEGLYVTDSASFPSQGTQNPTLTSMALTARACAHALGTRASAVSSEMRTK